MQKVFDFFFLSFMTPLHIFMVLVVIFVAMLWGAAIGKEFAVKKATSYNETDRMLTWIGGAVALSGPTLVNTLTNRGWPVEVVFLHTLSQCAIGLIIGAMAAAASYNISKR